MTYSWKNAKRLRYGACCVTAVTRCRREGAGLLAAADAPAPSNHCRVDLPHDGFFRCMGELADDPKNFGSRELHTIEPFEHHSNSTFLDIVSTRHLKMPIGSVSNLLMKFGATEWLRSEASVQIRHE